VETAETQPESVATETASSNPYRSAFRPGHFPCMSCKGFPPLSTFVPSVLPPMGPFLQTVATAIEKSHRPGCGCCDVNVSAGGVKAEARKAVKRRTGSCPARIGQSTPLAGDRPDGQEISGQIRRNDDRCTDDRAQALPGACVRLSPTRRRYCPWRPRARPAAGFRPSAGSRWKCRPASARRPCGRRAAGG
jgi:hypothetical protein